jgi:ribonuclease VapC
MMFVDASAIVAILTEAPEAGALLLALETAATPVTSPVAMAAAAVLLCRERRIRPEAALGAVRSFLATARVRTMSLTESEAETALDAFARFGAGSGHPAGLNLLDCFAYAAARNLGAPLLYAGEDFAKTDAPAAAG